MILNEMRLFSCCYLQYLFQNLFLNNLSEVILQFFLPTQLDKFHCKKIRHHQWLKIHLVNLAYKRQNEKASNLACEIEKKGIDTVYIEEFDEICQHLRKNVAQNDLVFIMGAGDVVNIGKEIIK